MTEINLFTNRANLSLLKKSDFNDVLKLFSEKDIFKFISPHRDKSKKDRLEFLELKLKDNKSGRGYYWIARDMNSNDFIGAINLTPIPESNDLQIGWMIAEAYRGKGMATELAMAAKKFFLENLNVEHIFAVFEEGNIASEKIIKKLNFKPFKTIREDENTIVHTWILKKSV
ncbi:GNAT family N-acetyltransferase [Mangrovivirga sp. M17]|uniref:GNAT family N-acetyltransferase n=1 Tax=Mangrovivirga halotolerans TaxID=2993936 RepID=A0ABT3RPC1_9BACT|nr:GNAT family N-acetyltransferase [Mangrovivirga halotolerans]MCX2743107.1 GNAT family N-acetyltransferase [Mangrovivirga halotolerans]